MKKGDVIEGEIVSVEFDGDGQVVIGVLIPNASAISPAKVRIEILD